jgi:hypothetical protein
VRERLAKLACTSSKLRRGFIKRAFKLPRPKAMTVALGLGGTAMAGVAGHGAYKQNKAGYDPAMQSLKFGFNGE